MPLPPYALDAYVAQEMSALSECRATPLAPEFPDSDQWFATFTLTRVFTTNFTRETVTHAFAVMRRAQAGLRAYEEGVEALSQFKGQKSIATYFRVLGGFETALTNTSQGLEFARKYVGVRLFETNDGSQLERMNRIYNTSRHYDPKSLPGDHLHALWLRNDGLHTVECALTYDELRAWLRSLCRVSDHLAKGQKTG